MLAVKDLLPNSNGQGKCWASAMSQYKKKPRVLLGGPVEEAKKWWATWHVLFWGETAEFLLVQICDLHDEQFSLLMFLLRGGSCWTQGLPNFYSWCGIWMLVPPIHLQPSDPDNKLPRFYAPIKIRETQQRYVQPEDKAGFVRANSWSEYFFLISFSCILVHLHYRASTIAWPRLPVRISIDSWCGACEAEIFYRNTFCTLDMHVIRVQCDKLH